MYVGYFKKPFFFFFAPFAIEGTRTHLGEPFFIDRVSGDHISCHEMQLQICVVSL